MRVFAVSDLHLEYDENTRWLQGLSMSDYRNDILILAGDVSESLIFLEECFRVLVHRFRRVLFVPGNHDLWVGRECKKVNSLEKFWQVSALAAECDVSVAPIHCADLSIVPLYAWYDYSFGAPSAELITVWMDYRACLWPEGLSVGDVASRFAAMNKNALTIKNRTVISFSHFLPRIDVMPGFIPRDKRILYPVLGSTLLEEQIRDLHPQMHVYGHSHVNRQVVIDGITYINNALGYPGESGITARALKCIYRS